MTTTEALRRDDNGMLHVERVLVSPETAQEWLERPTPWQRRIMPSHVRKLADDMRADRWNPNNAQPIQLARDGGWILDGRHRLMAVAETGRAQTFAVYFNGDPDTFDVIDANATRTPAHVLEAEGVKNAKELEAVSRLIYSWSRGAAEFRSNPARMKVLDIMRRYGAELQPLFVAGEKASKQTRFKISGGRTKNPLPKSIASFCAFLEGTTDGIIGRIGDWPEEEIYNHPADAVALLLNTLKTRTERGADIGRRAVISLFIMAKNLDHTSAPLPEKGLKYRSSAAFPLPEWPVTMPFGVDGSGDDDDGDD